jgi:uncharacterized protein
MAIKREFQIFAKPVGATCNLACHYCYYLDNDCTKDKAISKKPAFIMPDNLLERYIIQHIKASPGRIINFSWHGGEPLMAGIDFYRKIIALQKKNIHPGLTIVNGIQTNGTLLNDELCDLFAREKFIIGISIDGPEKYHDIYRRNTLQQPSFKKVMNGIRFLKQYEINFEILCVVHAGNVKNPLDVYRFLKRLGTKYMTFLPLVINDPENRNGVSKDSVPSDDFGNFMITVFDDWVANDIGKVKVQLFEEAARTAFRQDHTLCIFKKECGGVPVIERDGNFYSCDHYVYPEFLVGNIMETDLDELLDCKIQKDFGRLKFSTLPKYCRDCEVREMCNGGCPKDRFISAPDGEPGLNYLCSGYRKFFNHSKPFINAIATAWRNQNKAEKPTKATAVRINRNDLCPCGSGKKYKRCCI